MTSVLATAAAAPPPADNGTWHEAYTEGGESYYWFGAHAVGNVLPTLPATL